MIPRIRLLLQLLFLALSLSVFFGVTDWRPLISFYNSLHILPFISSLAWLVLPPMAIVTVLFLLLPLLAGRFYCSYLCPVGFVQDIVRRLQKLFGREGKPASGFLALRYFVLAMVLAFIVLHSSAWHYFDHFSNLGRSYGFVRAAVTLSPLGPGSIIAIIFLVLVILPAVIMPRWYCNVICPSGALYMLLQRRSLWKIRTNDLCTDCGECQGVCPVLCIKDGRVDQNLCINCLECIPACPADAITFSFRNPFARGAEDRPQTSVEFSGRRKFLTAAFAWTAGILAAWQLKARVFAFDPDRTATVLPPGAKSADQFLEKCFACGTCVSVCPTKVLRPLKLENSLAGFAKPRMDYNRSFCSHECNVCLAVCPTGAISYFPLEVKKKIKIGSSRLHQDLCITYAQGTFCGACHEVCPTGAITMKDYKSVPAPVLRDEYCIGCGACQFACPVEPKAITVEPLAIHTFAFNPKQHGPDASMSAGHMQKPSASEFPF